MWRYRQRQVPPLKEALMKPEPKCRQRELFDGEPQPLVILPSQQQELIDLLGQLLWQVASAQTNVTQERSNEQDRS